MKLLNLNFSLVLISLSLYYTQIEAFVGDYFISFTTESNNKNHQKQLQKKNNHHSDEYRNTIFSFPFTTLKINANENENILQQLKTLTIKPLKIKSKIYNNTSNRYYNNHRRKNKNTYANGSNGNSNSDSFVVRSNAFTTNTVNETKTRNTNIMSVLLPTSSSSSPSELSFAKSKNSNQLSPSSNSSIGIFSAFVDPENYITNTNLTIKYEEKQQQEQQQYDHILLNSLENNSKNERNKNNTIIKENLITKNSWNNKTTTIPSLFSSFSNINDNNSKNDNYVISRINDGNVIISGSSTSSSSSGGSNSRRDIRDVSNFEEDEIGWTNINEEVDMTIPLVLSHFQELGMTHFKLPDIKEGISVSPLFITYSAELTLFNGAAYNIEGIYRNGNAMMTYRDKAFQFRLNLIIKKLQFEYDFLAKAMIVSIAGGVVGTLENVLISSDFSIDARDPALKLNDFRIIKYGNIIVQLNHNRIVQELSRFVLSPITNLFRDRITTTISEDIKDTIAEMLIDFSSKDQLGIKKFTKQALSGLIRNDLDSSKKSSE